MSKKHVDTVLYPSWIIPIVPRDKVLEGCAIAIHNGQITHVAPTAEINKRFETDNPMHLEGHAILPGLINCHGHLAMSLLRGYADDLALMPWLQDHIWPAEAKWMNDEFVKDGAELAIAEMLLSGTTCFSDMYFFPEVVADTASKVGIRAQITFPILDFPTAWGNGPEDYFNKGLALHDKFKRDALITIGFGPHAPYTVSDDVFKKTVTYAEELQAPIQIHLHETEFEVNEAIESTKKRPITRLHDLHLFSPACQCVHVTQTNEEDIKILSSTGAHVIHCPSSNLKLASGACSVQEMVDAGINVALGTDGAASNNDLDMFAELQAAALLAKHHSRDASALSAMDCLEMATINGAKALGIDAKVGSIEAGKDADLCSINLNALHFQPVYNPISQLVYTNSGSSVENVWVQGKQLVNNRKLSTLSAETIVANAKNWASKIQRE